MTGVRGRASDGEQLVLLRQFAPQVNYVIMTDINEKMNGAARDDVRVNDVLPKESEHVVFQQQFNCITYQRWARVSAGMGTGGGWWGVPPSWTLNWPPIIKILNGLRWGGTPIKDSYWNDKIIKIAEKFANILWKGKKWSKKFPPPPPSPHRKNGFDPPPSIRTLAHLWVSVLEGAFKGDWTREEISPRPAAV